MGDALETAIISMAVQGDALASAKAGQVTVDLTTAERAGVKAEDAAKGAGAAFATFGNQIEALASKLHLAVRVTERLAKAAGAGQGTSDALDAAGQGFSTAVATARLLRPLDAITGLPVAEVAGLAAGVYSGVSAYNDKQDQRQKEEEQAQRIADHVARKVREGDTSDVNQELLRAAGLAKLDHVLGSRLGQ